MPPEASLQARPHTSTNQGSELARRLRSLRTELWLDRPLTQDELAKALGIGGPSVSSWESTTAPKIPVASRLDEYARFFATRRTVAGDVPRLLREDELTDEERAERDKLLTELMRLRAAALGESGATASAAPGGLWHFPDGAPVRIIAGELDRANRPRFASGTDHNYMALTAYADVDSVIELFGYIKAANPASDVRFGLASRIVSDDLQQHIVLLGNMAWMQDGGQVFGGVRIPVRQVGDPDIADGEIFEINDADPRLIRPQFAGDDPHGAVLEDVGLFVRSRSPHNTARTLTICSGVFTRGVYGAVRTLTDLNIRTQNSAYLETRFGDATTFGVLMRVGVHGHAIATPDLRDSNQRLYEFSSDT